MISQPCDQLLMRLPCYHCTDTGSNSDMLFNWVRCCSSLDNLHQFLDVVDHCCLPLLGRLLLLPEGSLHQVTLPFLQFQHSLFHGILDDELCATGKKPKKEDAKLSLGP